MNSRRRRTGRARRAGRRRAVDAFNAWGTVRKAINESIEKCEDALPTRESVGWQGSIYGFCPVQGTGTVDGLCWYFRARFGEWTFTVWNEQFTSVGEIPSTPPRWETAGEHEDASWMKYSEAWKCIEDSIASGRSTNFT